MVSILIALGSAIGLGFGIVNAFPPLHRMFIHWSNSLVKNEVFDIPTLIELRYRNLITREYYIKEMAKYGYDEVKAMSILEASRRYLSVSDLLEAYRRGIISEKELDERLEQERFSPREIEKIKELMWYLPSVSDIIRFTVRDVYNEAVVQKYGYDEFFPSEEEIREVLEMTPEQRKNLTGIIL